MSDEDPSKTFFPDTDEPDLYGCLGVPESATADEIKKAYRKLALQTHPDKPNGDEKRFQQIGFAYAVLSDEKRRKRFDDTGRTDESFFEGEADWSAYFKELWKGEVNKKTLDDFVKGYKDEERNDILTTYTDSEGSLGALFENVMCSNVLDDEERFITIVTEAIKAKKVSSYPQWKKDIKDTKAREKRKKDASGEAAEAEELAKELGVHDAIFGEKNAAGEVKSGGKKKGKGKGQVNEDGVDEDALRELIQSRHSKNNTMGNLIEKLETKYGQGEEGEPKGKKKKQKSKAEPSAPPKGTGKKRGAKEVEEPTEEEFEALQKKLIGDKKGDEAEPAGRSSKRGKKT